jgi:putative photosynthetic complex assembly protein
MTAAPRSAIPFRTWPIIAAGMLAGLAVGAALTGRLSGVGTLAVPESAPVQAVDLVFSDHRNGSVVVANAADGRIVLTVPPGEGGFIRGVMRGLARDRKMRAIGPDLPFRLERRRNGMVILLDPATGREIALGSFGPTNLEAFSQLLPTKDGST